MVPMKRPSQHARKRRSQASTIVAVGAALVMAGALPAHAGTASFYNETGCLGGDKKLKASTTIVASDSGSRVYLGSGSRALVYLQNCAENASRYANLSLQWTITAHGFGIDGCGVGIPPGFSCSGSSSSRSISFNESASNANRVDQYIGGASFYFSDGSWGDTSKICTKVDGKLGTSWVLTVEGCTNT